MKQREIKFRAWDKTLKRFVYFTLGELFSGGLGYGDIGDFEVCQSTELKDKNDTEIYEGDIVDSPVGNGEVEWFVDSWIIGKSDENGNYSDLCSWGMPEIEVIGNIYENKDLLK